MRSFLWAACLSIITASASLAQVIPSPAERAAYQHDKQALNQNPNLEVIPGSILVKFKANTPRNAAAQALAASQARAVRLYSLVPNLVHVRTPLDTDRAIEALSKNPWVDYAEPDYVVHKVATPSDTYFSLQWGLHNTGQFIQSVAGTADADIDMVEAWDVTTGDSGMVIAVIDTGTQWSHPDLDANIWSNTGEIAANGIDDDGNGYVDDIRGWDFFDNDNNPDDGDGHGTHTSGTIGAEGNNGIGVAGVAWRCKIMPLRFLGPAGGSTSDAIEALSYAVAKGIKVSNNSWGGGGYSVALYNAIANARSIGHIFVAAAGNGGVDTDSSPHYPSSYALDNIISVAATDNRDGLASFSNYGLLSVDIGAPGVNIASTYSGSGYVWLSGTSMAAPHVAGVAALVYLRNPGFTYDQVIDRILLTVRPVAALDGKCFSGGVLNAHTALTASSDAAPTVTISAPADGSIVAPGQAVTFAATATDVESGNVAASLAWTSSRDGAIGYGAGFITSALSVGTHTITATASDAGGQTGSDSVTVIVGTTPAAPDAISAVNNRKSTATVSWRDNSNNEVSFQIERQKQNTRKGTWRSPTYFSVGEGVTDYRDSSGVGTFRYRVRARNAIGDSNWSALASVKVTRK